MLETDEFTILLGEIQTANTKAQTALIMVQAIRLTLATRSADFEVEFLNQLEAVLDSTPPSLPLAEILRLCRNVNGTDAQVDRAKESSGRLSP